MSNYLPLSELLGVMFGTTAFMLTYVYIWDEPFDPFGWFE